jgi:hypothetical protein
MGMVDTHADVAISGRLGAFIERGNNSIYIRIHHAFTFLRFPLFTAAVTLPTGTDRPPEDFTWRSPSSGAEDS